MPINMVAAVLKPYKYAAIIFALYFLYLTCHALYKRRAGSELMLFAISAMLCSIFKEVFIGGPQSWIPIASLNFVICFSIIIFQMMLQMIKRTETLEMKAILDHLTGLWNRSYLLDPKYWESLRQSHTKKHLLFLDLDLFKNINDTYGHKIGDHILIETGRRLKEVLKDTDLICRYGGDEFLAVIKGEEIRGIEHIAENIIHAINRPFAINGKDYHIGISIGITEIDETLSDIESIIKSSDDAMYKAKKNGGNRYYINRNCEITS